MPNRFTPIQPNTEDSQKWNAVNNNFAQLDHEGVKKIYKDTDGNNRIFLDGTTGSIKVAKEGFDVTTATNAQLAFNSAQNSFKVVDTGIIDIPACSLNTGGANYGFSPGVTVAVAHGLGYIPAVIAFLIDVNIYVPLPWDANVSTGAAKLCRVSFRVTVDETYIYGVSEMWGYNCNETSVAKTARYYLLQETAN